MQIILLISILVLAIIFYRISKKTNQKVDLLLNNVSGLIWALKSKGILDFKDIEEGRKVSRGEKMAPLSLKDFMPKESGQEHD